MGALEMASRGELVRGAQQRPSTGPADAADPTWTPLPTGLLLEELRRRGDGTAKPSCGSRTPGRYDTVAHVFALVLILVLSTLACGFPLLSRRAVTGKRQRTIIFYCQHVGTGVLLATAFVHLLPTAFKSLTEPCLPYFFSEGYKPLAGLVAMISAIVVVGVESYLTARGAGHAHSHAHGFFGEDSNDDYDIDGRRTFGSERVLDGSTHGPRLRPRTDLVLSDDADIMQGLFAGVSPLPQSTPVMASAPRVPKASVRDSFDHDSDLDLDLDELDPVPSHKTRHAEPLYASLKRRDGEGTGPGEGEGGGPNLDRASSQASAAQTQQQQRRQLLQCLLLEAGILFHSVFIGMAVSVTTGPAFAVFLVAISFHQSFEGLALGGRIAAIQFPRSSVRPWLMVAAYGLTTPLGQAIGLAVHRLYDPASAAGLLVVGFMNAVSAGLLLYAGLVQLLAEDFLSEKSYRILSGTGRRRAYLAVIAGAVLMAFVGAFA